MTSRPPFRADGALDDLDLGPGPYDNEPEAPAGDVLEPEMSTPLTGPVRRHDEPILRWRSAQGSCAEEMAEVAWAFGQLSQRLRSGSAGCRHRLALLEVADLGWWAGEHVGIDRLILACEDRLAGVQDHSQALAALLWSVRRLQQPLGVEWDAEGIAAFLGRSRAGQEPGADIRAVQQMLKSATGLHALVRGAMVFHLWRGSGLGGVTRELEAAVLGSRIGGNMGGAAGFLPLALSSGAGLRASGTAEERLQAWLRGAGQATAAALLHLDRLQDWRQRAEKALTRHSGRTPGRLLDLLADLPVLSAPLAEKGSGASRAAVQRNLDMMEKEGLIREITGQGRYRLWTVKF